MNFCCFCPEIVQYTEQSLLQWIRNYKDNDYQYIIIQVKRISIEKAMAKAASVDEVGNVAPDLLDMFKNWVSTINDVSEDRAEFVHRTIDHWRTAKPDHNVMVLNNKWHHDVSIQDGAHTHVEIPKKPSGTHGFDIYVFKVRITSRDQDHEI